MAGKKANLKALFSNTRSRVIIVFTSILLVIAVVVGIIKFSSMMRPPANASARLSSTPGGIQSVPGAINPTAQYAALQQKQNIEQAQQAAKTGRSAIPTIIRAQAFGQGVESVGPQNGEGGVGFAALSREENNGPQQSLWLQTLKDANCSKTSVDSVVSQGAVLKDLKAACTCIQLKYDGYKFPDLRSVCSCKELKAAGFNARQFKEAGYTAGRLRECGFDACELRGAGFTAEEMKDGGFSDGELKGAGFSDNEIARAGGLPDGITAEDVRKAGCSVDGLSKLRASGVSAAAIRRISGCSAAQMKAAGFTAEDLKNAGFSAADLLKAGFTPEQLKAAGYSARDLLNAGFTPAELAAAGFTPEELKAAEAELPPGVTPESLKANGCSVDVLKRERLASVSAMSIRQYAGCSAEALKAAGFTDNDLANAGFTAAQIRAASAAVNELAKTPVSDAAVRAAGCDPKKLHELFLQGASAEQIHKLNGCSAEALKMAGFSAKDLANAGFTPEQLLAAGYTPEQLKQAGLSAASIIAAGRTADCSVASLKAARSLGVSALTIKQTLGCSAKQMKEAGYTAAELKAAGFTAADLKDAGFSAQDLKNAGFSAKELRAAGFNAQQLKDAGFTASQLKSAGFSAGELKNAGFTAAQLKALGFTAKELKDAGYSADELRKAGFSAKEMKDAGFTASQLKNAGYSAQEIQNAGFSANDAAMAGLEGANPPPTLASVVSLPSFGGGDGKTSAQKEAAQIASTKQLQEILKRQQTQIADQRYQQKIQAKTMSMLTSANQDMQSWKTVSAQTYMAGTPPTAKGGAGNGGSSASNFAAQASTGGSRTTTRAIIKTGDILFAVIDTSVNSDEPGPILATVVSGKLKGAKLIGSFTLPSNANKMVITFRTMSVPGAANVTTINAYAIDPNTARTALSSRTNHHYLSRYGSLFAATFLEGFGNAFQSANTTITVGGTGSVANTTIQNGVGRSILENAVIGLATLGKSWGQIAMQNVNRPITVDLYSGTGIGVLFTQDVASI